MSTTESPLPENSSKHAEGERDAPSNGAQPIPIAGVELITRLPEGTAAADVEDTKHRDILRGHVLGAYRRFVDRMISIAKYHKTIGAIARQTYDVNFATLFALAGEIAAEQARVPADAIPKQELDLKLYADPKAKTEPIVVSFKVYRDRHVNSIQEFRKNQGVASRLLDESSLQQIVNSLDGLIAQIVQHHLLASQGAGIRERSISFAEVLGFKSVEEIRDLMLSLAVRDVMQGSLADHLVYIRDKAGIDLKSLVVDTDLLGEVALVRNLLVHGEGIVTADFIRRVSGLKAKEDRYKKGKRVELDGDFVLSAWDEYFVAGVILAHAWAQRVSRSAKDSDLTATCDGAMVDAGFEAIGTGRLEAARRVLEYAKSTRLESDSARLRTLVNLAQAHKWAGREAECQKVLRRQDWSTCSSLYRLCVAALKMDRKMFERELKVLADTKEIDSAVLYEWPVFREIREKWDFDAIVSAVLGPDGPSARNRVKSMLLIEDAAQVRAEIQLWLESLQGRAASGPGQSGVEGASSPGIG